MLNCFSLEVVLSSDATVMWGGEWGRGGGQSWFLQSERLSSGAVPEVDASPRKPLLHSGTPWPGDAELLGLCFLNCCFPLGGCASVESKASLFFFFYGVLQEIGWKDPVRKKFFNSCF